MWPIRSPFGLRTAVLSTRSLAISGCGFAITSVIIPPSRVDEADQRYSPERVPSGGQGSGRGSGGQGSGRGSGGQGSGFRLGIVVKGDCLEAIVAHPAAPQVGDAAGGDLNPVPGGDWVSAIGAGIFLWEKDRSSCHGASRFCFLLKTELRRWFPARGPPLPPVT